MEFHGVSGATSDPWSLLVTRSFLEFTLHDVLAPLELLSLFDSRPPALRFFLGVTALIYSNEYVLRFNLHLDELFLCSLLRSRGLGSLILSS